MTSTSEVLNEVAGRQITQCDVTTRLQLSGAWFDALSEIEDEALAAQAAAQEGLTVSDAELQNAVDEYRLSRELEKADDTHCWLESIGLSIEDVEQFLEADVLQSKLAEKLIDDAKIESHYNQNPKDFEYARVSHIVTEEKGAAEELALSAREEGEDFAQLARDHSLDESTRTGGGFLGLVTRAETSGLSDDVADRIFAATAGDVIGPFDAGNGQILVRIEEVGRLPLDDDLRCEVRQQLFGQWLAEKSEG